MSPKPIDQLCAEDPQAHPIWEYAMESEHECDETHVRPTAADEVPAESDDVVYHVACDLRTPSGKALSGFIGLCYAALHAPDPIIVGAHPGEYICLDHPPGRRERAVFDAVIGIPFLSLFPLRWRLRARVAGETELRSGECSR